MWVALHSDQRGDFLFNADFDVGCREITCVGYHVNRLAQFNRQCLELFEYRFDLLFVIARLHGVVVTISRLSACLPRHLSVVALTEATARYFHDA